MKKLFCLVFVLVLFWAFMIFMSTQIVVEKVHLYAFEKSPNSVEIKTYDKNTGTFLATGLVAWASYWDISDDCSKTVAFKINTIDYQAEVVHTQVSIKDLSTGNVRSIVFSKPYFDPVFSPDGSKIVMLTDTPLTAVVSVIDISYGSDKIIFPIWVNTSEAMPVDWSINELRWSTDSKYIAFSAISQHRHGYVVYMKMPADEPQGRQVKITEEEFFRYRPSKVIESKSNWIQDKNGARILFEGVCR